MTEDNVQTPPTATRPPAPNETTGETPPAQEHQQSGSVTPSVVASDRPFTARIVGVRFRTVGKVYDYDAREFKFIRGDQVVCDVPDKGQMLGWVSKPTIAIPPESLRLRLAPVLRPANHNDVKNRERHEQHEREALNYVREMTWNRKLPMHVIAVEIPLSGKKAHVYFTSEQRVDFRDLIQDLVHYFKMRVELRQLGARDETKFIGGIGPCGQETCCSRFLTTFHKVSTRMAKDQGLSLTPTKVSGNCGRLKCCLAYEQPVYAEARKTLPKLGNCVKCTSGGAGGCGIVTKLDILKQMVTVRFDDGTFENVPVGRILEVQTVNRNPKPQNMKITRDDEVLTPNELATVSESSEPEDDED